jgi:hypothetical protein
MYDRQRDTKLPLPIINKNILNHFIKMHKVHQETRNIYAKEDYTKEFASRMC